MNRRIDLRTVGQIVSAIGLLHVFPSEEKAGEFLVPLLTCLPGCRAASLCFRHLDSPVGDLKGEQCPACLTEQRQLAETNQYACRLVEQDKVLAYPLETSVQQYGHLILSVQNLDEYKQYEPFVRNLGNVLAIILENRQQQQELLEGRILLEQRITDRTQELRRANEELRKEITNRKQAEEALQRNQRLLEETERIGKVGGWEFKIATGKQTWTHEIYHIHEVEYTFDPTVEKGVGFYTAESRPIVERAVRRAIEHGEPFDLELEIVTAKGNLRSVHTIGESDIERLRIYGFFQDITDRKRTEEALRRSEEKFRSIYEESPIGIEFYDREGTLSDANRACLEIFGISDVSAIKGFKLFDDPNLTEELKAQLRRCEIVSYEIPFDFEKVRALQLYETTKNGTIYLDLLITPLRDVTNESAIGYLVHIRDITERKQAEAHKEQLEVKNRQLQKAESLGRMAGAIAHTFNNQLGVVIGNLEMAIEDLPQGAGSASCLTTAMRAANKAAEVSGQMLTYLGQSFDKRERIDLAGVCQKNLSILKASMPGTVELETDLSSPGPAVMANASEIQQVLANLITNAWEAVGTGRGSIHLSVKTISSADIPTAHRFPVGWQPQDSAYACIEVSNTGDGIAEKDIEKIFDPFFSSKFTGRGLGLAIVLGIVKAHEGTITVASTPGQGSTFRVFLPVTAEVISKQRDPVVKMSARSESGTVLLIEDEEMLRNMATTMMTRLGFTVLAAKDGVEAIEIFRKRREEIRLVLSDLTMPHMDGWETLTALRKLHPDIPVILASGYDEAQIMAGDHSELPQAFLGKPYKLKSLDDAIKLALLNKK
jgi:PAS domain S-box-containing protein